MPHLRRPRPRRPEGRRPAATRLLLLAFALLPAIAAGGVSAVGLAPSPLATATQADDTDTTTTAIPLGQEGTAGPLAMTIVEVVSGPAAVDQVLAADPTNQPPREGVTYLIAAIETRNDGDRPLPLDGGDFALLGDRGVPRRFLDARPPDPVLDGPLAPAETRRGWVAFALPADETPVAILFDSLSLPGLWADARFDLGADPPPIAPPASLPAPNEVGADPAAPATIGERIVTADWAVELVEVATGAEVFALVDYRAGALGEGDAVGNDGDGSVWVALHLNVTNVGTSPAGNFLPANAFAVVDAAGDPIPDLITLTPPRPDASGPYEPGTTRDGWVAFDIPQALAATTVRFLPYAETGADPDPRYLVFE